MSNHHRNGDRLTKQMIVGTICLCATMITGATVAAVGWGETSQVTAMREMFIFILGGLLGLLGRTTTDAEKTEPQTVKTEPGQPLQTVEAEPKKDEPDNPTKPDEVSD